MYILGRGVSSQTQHCCLHHCLHQNPMRPTQSQTQSRARQMSRHSPRLKQLTKRPIGDWGFLIPAYRGKEQITNL